MILARHDDFKACRGDDIMDLLVINRDNHAANFGFLRPQRHLHDHRQPANIGQRLAWKTGRCHAGRDQHEHVI
ncbi:hypothetical protein D3C85_1878610 [compost metagenome]